MTALTRRVATTSVFVAALFTTIIVSRYLTLNPEVYFPEQRQTYLDHTAGILTHVVGGMIAMFLGPFQFIPGLRNRYPRTHRWCGRLYLAGCAMGGAAGLYMATFAYGGFPAGAGFGLLALVWLTCSFTALAQILRRRIPAHREWMLRSYALTLAAFSLRVWLIGFSIVSGPGWTSLPFAEMYTAVAWLCWVPNLIAAEFYINLSRK